MAGYTDAAFRSLCVEFGAILCFAEMVSAEALARGRGRTLCLLEQAPNEKHVGFQIFASNQKAAAASVRLIGPLNPSIIDLNCGCSVPKILKGGCGAALLRDPAAIGSLVAAMRQETDLPVSVKLRSGWDSSSINYLECAEAAVENGAKLVTLHPRTRAQGFSGKARWEEISRLKLFCRVPVMGSGDLFTPQDCLRMLEETGCDGVMIARGCIGNPFIFQQTVELLTAGDSAQPIGEQLRLQTALRHLRLLAASVGETKACRDMRKHFVAYTKGMPGSAFLRQSIVRAQSIPRYEEIVRNFTG